jgi:hypothetical protein
MRRLVVPVLLLATLSATLSGCAAAALPAPAPVAATPVLRAAGLERVLGQPASALVAMFGPADLDVHEETAQRLQFRGPFCVLDAYLYPDGRQPATVRHVDARQPDGRDFDRLSCVTALTKRHAAGGPSQ